MDSLSTSGLRGKGRWNEEEIRQLKLNMVKCASEMGLTIEMLLTVPRRCVRLRDRCLSAGIGRPKKAVLQKVRGVIEQSKPSHGKRFTEEERRQLLSLFLIFGDDWQEIGRRMNRSAKSVSMAYRRLKAFTQKEEERLVAAFEAQLDQAGQGVNWRQVADEVGGSTTASFCQRWHANLFMQEPYKPRRAWMRREYVELMHAVFRYVDRLSLRHYNDIDWSDVCEEVNFGLPAHVLRQSFSKFLSMRIPDCKKMNYTERMRYLNEHCKTIFRKSSL